MFVIQKVGTTNRFGSRYYIRRVNRAGATKIQYVFRRSDLMKELKYDYDARQRFLMDEYFSQYRKTSWGSLCHI